jgi:SLT domain-containing protein
MQTIRTIFKNNTNNIQNNIHNIVAILLISLQYKQYCWNHCFDINNM